jgi:hypothetical protein
MNIFLSYASEDRDSAEQIYLALTASGHQVFFDRVTLSPGGDYNARIRQAIRESELLIFLISPHSIARSSYALTELHFAREKWPHPMGAVLPVMLRPTDYGSIPNYLKAVTVFEPQGSAAAEVAAWVASRAGASATGIMRQIIGNRTRRVTSLVVVLSVVVVGFMIGPNLIRRLGPPAPVSVDEPVERLPLGDAYRKIASAVGMLVFNNQASCTAWLVSDEDLMTTDYCVPRLGAGAQRLVLRLGFLSPQASPLEYVVDPRPIEQDPELGYAILRVEGNPAERFGVLRLDTRDPEPGEGLFVLHHSLGKPLALARGNACYVTTAQIDSERNFGYTCNTHEGSGGAPVIAVSDLRILGLHHSSSRREAWSVARRFRLILERSRTLQTIIAGTSRRN